MNRVYDIIAYGVGILWLSLFFLMCRTLDLRSADPSCEWLRARYDQLEGKGIADRHQIFPWGHGAVDKTRRPQASPHMSGGAIVRTPVPAAGEDGAER